MTESLSISANLDENSLYNSNRFANDRSIESFSISREASDLSLNQMSGSIVSLNSSTVLRAKNKMMVEQKDADLDKDYNSLLDKINNSPRLNRRNIQVKHSIDASNNNNQGGLQLATQNSNLTMADTISTDMSKMSNLSLDNESLSELPPLPPNLRRKSVDFDLLIPSTLPTPIISKSNENLNLENISEIPPYRENSIQSSTGNGSYGTGLSDPVGLDSYNDECVPSVISSDLYLDMDSNSPSIRNMGKKKIKKIKQPKKSILKPVSSFDSIEVSLVVSDHEENYPRVVDIVEDQVENNADCVKENCELDSEEIETVETVETKVTKTVTRTE